MSILSVRDIQGIAANNNKIRIPSGHQLSIEGNFKLPVWTTGTRPISPEVGLIGYNTTLKYTEIYVDSGWVSISFAGVDGSVTSPFGSPVQAFSNGAQSGRTYFFRFGGMAVAQELEFQANYFDSRPWVRVFTSSYSGTATVNRLDLSIPMAGLLVQRDTLDIRAAVYWSTPITYNSVGGVGNNSADSGYSPRRVILGFAGGHGIYNTAQQQCNWGDSSGAVGAGWDGGTCGSFPNGLIWGTGQGGTPVYANRSGTWSHWVTWTGNN